MSSPNSERKPQEQLVWACFYCSYPWQLGAFYWQWIDFVQLDEGNSEVQCVHYYGTNHLLEDKKLSPNLRGEFASDFLNKMCNLKFLGYSGKWESTEFASWTYLRRDPVKASTEKKKRRQSLRRFIIANKHTRHLFLKIDTNWWDQKRLIFLPIFIRDVYMYPYLSSRKECWRISIPCQ